MTIEARSPSREFDVSHVEYGSLRDRSPFPIVDYLPAMLAEDDFTRRFVSGLDPVLASIIVVLDCFPDYLDSTTTSRPFIDYLGSWVGAPIAPGMSDSTAREALLRSASLNAGRGTMPTLSSVLTPRFGDRVSTAESGSTTVSREHLDPTSWPSAAGPSLTVTVHRPGLSYLEWELLEGMLADLVPSTVAVAMVIEPGAQIGSREASSDDPS